MSEPILELRGFVCEAGDQAALKTQDLRLSAGELAVLRGPSGSGKSTVLECLAGLRAARVSGASLQKDPLTPGNMRSRRSSVSWLPQDLPVSDYTVRELFNNVADLRINQNQKVCQKATTHLEQLSLPSDVLERPLAKLSGGERRRVYLSLVLALPRALILLDEPTAGLDHDSAILAVRLIEANTAAVLLTSHESHWDGVGQHALSIQ